jgi:hypothetical protein
VLQNKRERIEELGLEAQEFRARREIEKLRREDSEAEQRRLGLARAEELEGKRALEESQARRERERQQAEDQRERREWADSWCDWGLRSVPPNAPRAIALDVHESVEAALANLTPEQPQSLVQRLVLAAVDKALEPWKRQQDIERAVQEARKELPALLQRYFEPSEWEVRAMQAAREVISCLRPDASYQEMRAAAVEAGKRIASDYEAEQARARTERQEQQREQMKRLLVDFGVRHVSSYLSKLHSDGGLWDEDLRKKAELEATARKSLEGRLTGAESFEDVQRFAREVVDAELG